MSWFSRTATNVLSRARQVAWNVIPESVQRRVTDFINWSRRTRPNTTCSKQT